jgi:hypothetical protein
MDRNPASSRAGATIAAKSSVGRDDADRLAERLKASGRVGVLANFSPHAILMGT